MSKAKQSGLNVAMHTSGIFSDLSVDGPEIGTLVVVVDRAKNLPSRRSMGKQDPYCAARLGKEAKKTNTDRRGGQTPRWDQELRFTVRDSPDYCTLKVSVFNDDKRTELIGENFLKLDDVVVPGGGEAEMWHTLTCKGKYAGEVRLELTYYDSRPKVEKPVSERRRERSNTESPAVAGPRQTPVRRRPLPSDPNSAQSTPEPDYARSRALPPAGSVAYHTPLPQQQQPLRQYSEHTSGSNRRTAYNQSQPTPVEYRGPPSQSYQEEELPMDDPFSVQHPRSEYEPSVHPQDEFEASHGYQEPAPTRRHTTAVSSVPYPMHDGPPVVAFDQPRHNPRTTAVAPTALSHSNSAPIVPYFATRDPRHQLHHTVSDSQVQDMHHSTSEQYHHLHGEQGYHNYYAEPDEYLQQDRHHSSQPLPYADRQDYSTMQPFVEEDAPPPPPPTHRSSAPNSGSYHRASMGGEHTDMAPAPLKIHSSRMSVSENMYSDLSNDRSGEYQQPHSSMYDEFTQHDNFNQRSQYGTPDGRNSGSAVGLPLYARDPLDMSSTAYSSPPDSHRRTIEQSHRSSLPPHLGSSPASLTQRSPYQTPPRGTHPLASQQSATYGSSPTAPLQYSPADAVPPPLIKPTAVSPAQQQYDRAPPAMRPAVNVNFVRKSVPDQGNSRGSSASTPFSPDSFDTFNPNLRKPAGSSANSAYSTPSRSQHGSIGDGLQLDQSVRQSPYNDVDPMDNAPIHDFHGNVVDPSDRLPVDSWAPEPERKGFSFKAQITPRERDRLTGARSMGNSPSGSFINGENPNELDGSFNMSTRSDVSSHVSAGSSLLATVGSNRNKLQKKSRPQSEYFTQSSPLHGPGQSTGAGNYPYVNNSTKRSSYDVRAGGGVPPIPAKIPLDDGSAFGDMDRLNSELASIDIGPSSNAMVRRPRRLGF